METLQRRLALVLAAVAFAAAAGAFLYAQVAKTSAAPIYRTNFDGARFFSPERRQEPATRRGWCSACGRPSASTSTCRRRRRARCASSCDGESRQGDVRLAWDGSTDAGEPAPDGVYRVRVHLYRQDDTITLPRISRSTPCADDPRRVPPATAASSRPRRPRPLRFATTASEPVSLRLRSSASALDGRRPAGVPGARATASRSPRTRDLERRVRPRQAGQRPRSTRR